MKLTKIRVLVGLAVLFALASSAAQAGRYHYRQYYSGWYRQSSYGYYYSSYYYKPYYNYSGYSYHYAVYYPSQPRYVYYYNPYKKAYWGRFDTQGKPGQQYSLLAPADRKENLKDIPESAFPKPGKMPVIPDSEDGARIDPPKDLPRGK